MTLPAIAERRRQFVMADLEPLAEVTASTEKTLTRCERLADGMLALIRWDERERALDEGEA